MNISWSGRRRSAVRASRWRWLAAPVAAATMVGALSARPSAGVAATASGPQYQSTIVRTAYGVPHITAGNFGSLGYGYGFALASDDLCTVANGYVTVEGQRSRYFGQGNNVPMTPFSNLDSDVFWQSVIDRQVIPQLLVVKTGPGAVGPQLRQLISGYAAGYNDYLASVGGSAGVPDATCRGQAWVKPITALDAYLLIYQAIDMQGEAASIRGVAEAQPPASTTTTTTTTATAGLPSAAQSPDLSEGLPASSEGSNAIAVGSAGTADHHHSVLLGNPHFPWDGIDRFYEVQFTIPGTMNVEGATLFGIPLVVIGFTSGLAWSLTVSPAQTITPYQLTLVPGQPTQYVVDGKPVAMTSQTVSVPLASGESAQRTLWSTRYGPVAQAIEGTRTPWTAQTAFAIDDPNAANFRFLSQFLATDEAQSVPHELAILKQYQGLPFVDMLAADSAGQALYADIQAIPNVTDAKAAQCDTAAGTASFQETGLPVLDGSRSACAPGTDADSAAPGIFGPDEEPSLVTRDFVENSNDSYWLADPAHPLTGFPRVIGTTGADLGLRTRSALSMVMRRIAGADGNGPAGFTFKNMENLMFSNNQYGATLVKPQLVAMCRSFSGGLAPTDSGTISVGDSCSVLAAWDGKENPGSQGDVLFRDFWERVLSLPNGPWSHPFDAANPINTPSGLDTTSTQVQEAFGDALADLTAAQLPYNVPLGALQYVVRNGQHIPLPGGPGDPDGEFNAIYQDLTQQPEVDPSSGSSYIQDVTWASGNSCPEAATLLTYSESDNATSPHYADQTELFSQNQMATAYFCPAQVTAHAISTTELNSH
jgi:acyl-homoserine-lactone acylase